MSRPSHNLRYILLLAIIVGLLVTFFYSEKRFFDKFEVILTAEVACYQPGVSLNLRGASNLVDGTKLRFEVADKTGNHKSGTFTVSHGEFSGIIDVQSLSFGDITVVLQMDPRQQSRELQKLYGANGERLAGKPVLEQNGCSLVTVSLSCSTEEVWGWSRIIGPVEEMESASIEQVGDVLLVCRLRGSGRHVYRLADGTELSVTERRVANGDKRLGEVVLTAVSLNEREVFLADYKKVVPSPQHKRYAIYSLYHCPIRRGYCNYLWLLEPDSSVELLTPEEINGYSQQCSNELQTHSWVDDVVWSPSGDKIAYTSDRIKHGRADVWVVSLDSGRHEVYPLNKSISVLYGWLSDSEILYLSMENNFEIGVLSLSNPDNSRILCTNGEYWQYGLWQAGKVLRNKRGALSILDIESGSITELPERFNANNISGVTATGKMAFYSPQDTVISIVDAVNRNQVSVIYLPFDASSIKRIRLIGECDGLIFTIWNESPTGRKQGTIWRFWAER